MMFLKGKFRFLSLLAVFLLIFSGPLIAKEPVVFADLSWESIQLHNRIAGFIFTHGYGEKVDYLFVDLTAGLMGLERGDIDINMELWPTFNLDWWDKARAKKTVVDLGVNFEGASQGWYVPTYVIKGDPKRGIKASAPDLKSVFDLPRYWELFRDAENKKFGRLLNGPTRWVAHDINITKLEGYGLDKNYKAFSPGSGTALDTAIVTAYKQGKPILFYYWEPTWLLGRYDMTRLEEPPFDEKLWTPEGKFLCTWLTATTYVVANSKFLEKNPPLAAFLKNYSTSLEQNQKALSWLEDNGNDMAKGAIWFLKEYPDTWKGWITGSDRQEIIAKIEKAL